MAEHRAHGHPERYNADGCRCALCAAGWAEYLRQRRQHQRRELERLRRIEGAAQALLAQPLESVGFVTALAELRERLEGE